MNKRRTQLCIKWIGSLGRYSRSVAEYVIWIAYEMNWIECENEKKSTKARTSSGNNAANKEIQLNKYVVVLCIAYNHRKCGQIEMFFSISLEYYYILLHSTVLLHKQHFAYVVHRTYSSLYIKSFALFLCIGRAFHLDGQFEWRK